MTRYMTALFALTATTALADAPRVVTEIAPVHGLTARVMDGVGTPDLIVTPGVSPHDFALRPSQALAIQEAGLVIWTGPGLTPWLETTIDNLSDAEVVTLNALPETHLLEWRDADSFAEGAHDHGDHDDHEEHEAHDDHDHGDHDHGGEDHAEHAHDDGHAGHDHGPMDPHSWLDPENAKRWTQHIAETLAAKDPDNAAAYRANAEAALSEIDDASARVAERLAAFHDTPYVVFHDAYHYFEAHFDLHAAASVAESDAAAPGPGHVRDLQDRIARDGVVCLFTEPQFDTRMIDTLAENTTARMGVLDPLGTALKPGADFYPALLESMAESMVACFKG